MASTSHSLSIIAQTHTGLVREHNEDNFVYCSDSRFRKWHSHAELTVADTSTALFVVTDGMGGTAAGEVASAIVVGTFQERFSSPGSENFHKFPPSTIRQILIDAILASHAAIKLQAKKDIQTKGMGATIVVALVIEHTLHVAWVGDSRLYRVKSLYGNYEKSGRFLELLSADHSLVWEMVTKGELTPEQARTHAHSNIITQSLGDNGADPQPDYFMTDFYEGDRLMLCSDGVNGELSDDILSDILMSNDNLETVAQDISRATLRSGANDNFTFIIVDKFGGGPRENFASAKNKNKSNQVTSSSAIDTQKDPLKKAPKPVVTGAEKGISMVNRIMLGLLFGILLVGVWYFFKDSNNHSNIIIDTKHDEIKRMIGQFENDSIQQVYTEELDQLEQIYNSNQQVDSYIENLYDLESKIKKVLANLEHIEQKPIQQPVTEQISEDSMSSQEDNLELNVQSLLEKLSAQKSNYDQLLAENKFSNLPAVEEEFKSLTNMLQKGDVFSEKELLKIEERLNYIDILIQKNLK